MRNRNMGSHDMAPEDDLKRDPDHRAILARRNFLVAAAMTSLASMGSCARRGLQMPSPGKDAGAGTKDLREAAEADAQAGSGSTDVSRGRNDTNEENKDVTDDGLDKVKADADGGTIDGDEAASDANPGKQDAIVDVLGDAKEADVKGGQDLLDALRDTNGSSCGCYSGGCGCGGCF